MKITAIKEQVKRKQRYSVFVDEKYAFSLSEGALVAQRLAPGQEIDAKRLAELKEAAGFDKGFGQTLRYIVIRPRSEGELHDYFRRKAIDEAMAAAIMDKLRNLDLVDDLAFARAWVDNRRLLKSTSRRRLKLELRQKKISDDIIQQVLEEDQVDEREALRELVAKKRNRYPDDQKLMQYLARQGFSYDDIKAVLRGEDD